MHASRNKGTVIFTIYVEDNLLLGKNRVLLKKPKEKLVRRFDIKCV